MKLKLTEQQVKGLINNLTDQDIDMEKEAPGLANFAKLMAKGNIPSQPNTVPNQSPDYATDIPSGNEMMHPLGHKRPISSEFGMRNINVRGASTNHKGIDISTSSGSPVYAPLDGIVSASRDTTPNGCGGFIKLDHANVETKFCHLSRMVVNQGDNVKKGQVIGYSGGGRNDPHPGTSSGPHLHYEILNKSGIAMNPVSVEPNLT